MGFGTEGVGFGGLASLGLPSGPNRDRFGLPMRWSLLTETKAERKDRIISVLMLLREVFAVAVRHMGDSDARHFWKDVAKGKPGRPKGRRKNPDIDAILLDAYDAAAATADEKTRKTLPRRLATNADQQAPGRFGASAGAIQQRIRRLLNERQRRAKAERDLAEARLRESGVPEGMFDGGFFDAAYDTPMEGARRRATARNSLSAASSAARMRAANDKKPD
jgi:hypothetical protein